MPLSNKYGLPDTIVRAARAMNDRYSKGPAQRSVTQLIKPPQIDQLYKKHARQIERDVSEEWWSLFGSAVHMVLELGATKDMIIEERMFTEVDGWIISGMCDMQEIVQPGLVSLSDYKVCAAYKVQKVTFGDEAEEWEQQLNLLSLLARESKGLKTHSLSVIALVRDWQRNQAQADPTYPVAPIVTIPIDLWSDERQFEYAKERVRAHRDADMRTELGLPLPECSPAERWSHADKWAVIKEGNKRAARIHEDEETALLDVESRSKGYVVEYRPGKSARCAGNYCQVAPWCEQWAAMQNPTETDDEQKGTDLTNGKEE